MATTRERLQQLDDLDALDLRGETIFKEGPVPEAPPAEPEAPAAESRPLPARSRPDEARIWSWGLLAAWVAILAGAFAIQPPANENVTLPWWSELLGATFAFSFYATAMGLALARRWGLWASACAAGLGMVLGAACGITEHHLGAWWAYELAAFGALAGASLIGLRATRS